MSDASERLLDTAIAIANRAPARQGQYVYDAKIPWRLIHDLRRALDDLDIEWKP